MNRSWYGITSVMVGRAVSGEDRYRRSVLVSGDLYMGQLSLKSVSAELVVGGINIEEEGSGTRGIRIDRPVVIEGYTDMLTLYLFRACISIPFIRFISHAISLFILFIHYFFRSFVNCYSVRPRYKFRDNTPCPP